MPRTRAVFDLIYSLIHQKRGHKLDFISISDKGINPKIMKARFKKEKESLKKFKILSNRFKTLRQFHKWLFTEHAIYCYGKETWRLPNNTLKTY